MIASHSTSWPVTTSPATVILAACAGLAPLLALLFPLGLTALLVVLAGALVLAGPRKPLWHSIPFRLALVFAAGIVWCLASALWAISPVNALHKSVQLAIMLCAGLIVIAAARIQLPATRQTIGLALAIGVTLALAVLLIERATNAPIADLLAGYPTDRSLLIKRYNRGATVIAVLLWPAAYALWNRFGWIAAAGLVIAGAGTLMLADSRAAMVGALLGVGFLTLALWSRRLSLATFALAAVLAVVLPSVLPAVILNRADVVGIREQASQLHLLSGFHRMRIWEFTAERIAERPLLGWGLDSARDLPGGTRETDSSGTFLPLHPHNLFLQLHVELGIPGVVLALILVAWIGVRGAQQPPTERSTGFMLAAAAAALVIASLSYGAWQSWWFASLLLASGYCRLLVDRTGIGMSGENSACASSS